MSPLGGVCMKSLVLVLILIAFAGCLGDDSGASSSGASSGDTTASGQDPLTSETTTPDGTGSEVEVTARQVVMEAIDKTGNLGTWMYLCETQYVGSCDAVDVESKDSDLYVEKPGTTLMAATLTLEWDALGPATERLGIGLMRMGDNSTLVQNVEGVSPLVIDKAGIDLDLDEENRVHIYVYNPAGLINQDPVSGYVTVSQEFTVTGSLTFLE